MYQDGVCFNEAPKHLSFVVEAIIEKLKKKNKICCLSISINEIEYKIDIETCHDDNKIIFNYLENKEYGGYSLIE